jgi:hypothetical protein
MFDITSVTVNTLDQVIRLGWTYATDEGSLSGKHDLLMPAGSKALDKVTKAQLIEWLKFQLGNTEEELIEGIKQKAALEAAAAAEREVPVPA